MAARVAVLEAVLGTREGSSVAITACRVPDCRQCAGTARLAV